MATAKEEVADLLARLPDDCSLEDIQYHLQVLQKIERCITDIEQGPPISRSEVAERMSKWLEK